MEKNKLNQSKKAIVLLSGGQDSTTCLIWAKNRFDEIHCLAFDYGQRHKQELIQAKEIASELGATFEIIDVKGIFIGGSLINHSESLNEAREQDSDLPSSFTAGRNMIFLSIASSRAYDMGISDIITGVCQTDFSGYPDCRDEFIKSMNHTIELALDKQIQILTPLMWLTKAETWKLAKEEGGEPIVRFIIEETLTDYNGDMTMNEWGRGKEDNPASVLRAKGFREAKMNGWI